MSSWNRAKELHFLKIKNNETFQCHSCLHVLPASEFFPKAYKTCKSCVQQQDRNHYLKNSVSLVKKKRQNRLNNYSRYLEMERKRKKRYSLNPQYVIACRLRARIRDVLHNKNNHKCFKSMDLLGCSIQEYRTYLEKLFTAGMSWSLFFEGKIHIDHIKPCDSFDLSDPIQQKSCFHFSNTQPLWATDNLKKGSQAIF